MSLVLIMYYILQSGRTPLHVAAVKNNKEIVEILIRAHADIDVADRVSYYQAP